MAPKEPHLPLAPKPHLESHSLCSPELWPLCFWVLCPDHNDPDLKTPPLFYEIK